MPEYHLPMGNSDAAKTFKALDSFTQAYVEAMFWTNANSADDEDLEGGEFAELADDSLQAIIEECKDFQNDADELLAQAYEKEGYDESSAGHDFWLTRNHHGTGFWDRGLDIVGDQLSKVAHTYGAVDLYRGDNGLIYCS